MLVKKEKKNKKNKKEKKKKRNWKGKEKEKKQRGNLVFRILVSESTSEKPVMICLHWILIALNLLVVIMFN